MTKKYRILFPPTELKVLLSYWDRTDGPNTVPFICAPEEDETLPGEIIHVQILLLFRSRENDTDHNYSGVTVPENEEVTGFLTFDSKKVGTLVIK